MLDKPIPMPVAPYLTRTIVPVDIGNKTPRIKLHRRLVLYLMILLREAVSGLGTGSVGVVGSLPNESSLGLHGFLVIC